MIQHMKEKLMLTLKILIKNKLIVMISTCTGQPQKKIQFIVPIMEHTPNTIKPIKAIIPSLLKVFSIFELHLFYYGDKFGGHIYQV